MRPPFKQPEETLLFQILAIWQLLFKKSTIGPDDDFFRLGGTGTQAIELFFELSVRYDRDLHPCLIFQASTARLQLELILDPANHKIDRLVTLKQGVGQDPIFLLHGIGGTVLELLKLASHIDVSSPIYGLQAKGSDGLEEPLESINEMARSFLDEIKKAQIRGPYFLVGHSMGGLVAFELAQQLLESGETIGGLFMLDSYPDKSQIDFVQRARLNFRLIRRRLGSGPVNYNQRGKLNRTNEKHVKAGLRALRAYRPRFYNGRVEFISATNPTNFPANARAIWKDLVHDLRIDSCPGDHHEMLTQYAQILGATLTMRTRVAKTDGLVSKVSLHQ
jgi:thioesterase domain-containing protein